jgi:alpha-mannosidase
LSRGDLRFRHGPAGPGLETPEAQSPGRHRFEYALTTFAGDWQAAGIVAQAHAFAYPPLAVLADAHAGTVPADAAALVQCDNPHVVLSALTASARPGAFVARWYNSSTGAQTAELTIPLAIRARAVNFLEIPTRARVRRVGPQRWRVHFRPFEIVTLQIRTR